MMTIAISFRSSGVQAQPADSCAGQDQPVAQPLTELGNHVYVRMDGQETDFTGGLYPDGSNERPPAHEAAGLAAAGRITPLDRQGEPDPTQGQIVMVSIGMSNTNEEFGTFMSQAFEDPAINPRLFFINGALGGQTAEKWVDPNALAWQELEKNFARYQTTPQQVQVAWVKLTLTRGGEFPAKALELQNNLETIVHNLRSKFPNLQIAYISSRTRSFTYFRGLSPEPLAYETGFSVKWLIEKQIQGDPSLNFDPAQGPVRAPFLAWGPYLWADGQTPRADGFNWLPADMTSDCTHPSMSGREKVADLLMSFFKSDRTAANWFLTGPSQPAAPTATPAPTITQEPIPLPSATILPAATLPRTQTGTPPLPACPGGSPCPTVTRSEPATDWDLGPGMLMLVVLAGSLVVGLVWWGVRKKGGLIN